MNELIETAYKLMEDEDFEKSLEIYKNILYSDYHEEGFIGTKYRAIKECFILANKYSPAMEMLLSYGNYLLKKLKNKTNVNTSILCEYAELCYLTKNDNDFLELFEHICKIDKESAQSVYRVVEKILINHKRWDLCNICIDDTMSYYSKLIEQYDELIRISNEHFHGDYNDQYKVDFCNKLQTLFWILKVGEREEESTELLYLVRKELQNRNIECEK